jgi:hypothetical protein
MKISEASISEKALYRKMIGNSREKKKAKKVFFSLKAARRNKSCLPPLAFFTPLESIYPITCSDIKKKARERETRVFLNHDASNEDFFL